MVQFEVDGVACRWNINDELEVMSKDDFIDDEAKLSDIKPEEARIKLPEAHYRELQDYNICDAPARPIGYIRFIEKSTEELDGEVFIRFMVEEFI